MEDTEVVARVAGEPITAEELRRALARAGGETSLESKRKVLDEALELKALAVAGRRAGYDQDREIREVVDRMVADRYLRELVVANPGEAAVSDEEVRAYYEQHRTEFGPPERARVSLIALRKSSPNAPGERIAALRAQVAAQPESFADVARQHSDDPLSRNRGGDVGWLPKGAVDYRVDPAVVDAIFALENVGNISAVVETDDTFVIAKLTDRSRPEPRPFADVAPAIKETLRAERERVLKEQRMAQLAAQLGVAINDDVLARIGSGEQSTASLPRPPAFPVAVPGAEAVP